MTENEKLKISTQSFDVLWYELWKNNENNTVLPPTAPLDYASAVPSRPIFPPPPPPPLPPFPVIPILPIQTDKKELYSVALAMKKMNVNVSSDYSQYNNKYNSEKYTSKDKYNILQSGYCLNGTPHFTINEIVGELEKERLCNIENNTEIWHVPEWGFCKGRRNYRESDYDCAIREMEEETGYSGTKMKLVKNINTFEEIFIGSNYKCYKHKYYLMYMSFEDSMKPGEYEKSEVSCTKWVSFDECLTLIRSYNIEKKRMITKIDEALNKYNLFMGQG
jgi:8-oxo-dGTP pyrophosphatase MutT (NUDIX family)